MIVRILIFVALFLIMFSLPWWISIPLMVLYMLRYTAYEVIVLAALFDAQFSTANGTFPFLVTLSLGTTFVFIELLKPFLSFYKEH